MSAERERDELDVQVERLARVIMEEVPGEPSEDEGAVDCAIRLLRDRNRLLERLDEAHLARIEAQNPGIDIERVREQRGEWGDARSRAERGMDVGDHIDDPDVRLASEPTCDCNPVLSDGHESGCAQRPANAEPFRAKGDEQRVTLEEIDRQRERGWPDFHPEDYCHRCGAPNPSWTVDTDRFNAAMSDPGSHRWQGIVCVGCFVRLHEAATGLTCTWRLVPETPFQPGGRPL